MKKYDKVKTFDELLNVEYGKIGSEKRNEYEHKSMLFTISAMLKTARKEAKITQEELAKRSGTKKRYISKLENGKANVQLSTLIRIFEQGLNKQIGLTFL